MNKLYYFILFRFAALCLTACGDDGPESDETGGRDRYIWLRRFINSDFNLTVGGETFNGSFTLNGGKPEDFTIEGIPNVQGKSGFMSYQKPGRLELPVMGVSGKMKVGLDRCHDIRRVIFSRLQEAGDPVFPSSRDNLETCAFPTVRKIRGSCGTGTCNRTDGITFGNPEGIGTSGMGHTAVFSPDGGETVCPESKATEGDTDVRAGIHASPTDKMSFPDSELINRRSQRISNGLTMECAANKGKMEMTDFSNLKPVKAISIGKREKADGFSSSGCLSGNDILAEASHRTVTGRACNPTRGDRKDGKYPPAGQV